jgi:hypothetical protein
MSSLVADMVRQAISRASPSIFHAPTVPSAASLASADLDQAEALIGPVIAEDGMGGQFGAAVAMPQATDRDGGAAGAFGDVDRGLDPSEGFGDSA